MATTVDRPAGSGRMLTQKRREFLQAVMDAGGGFPVVRPEATTSKTLWFRGKAIRREALHEMRDQGLVRMRRDANGDAVASHLSEQGQPVCHLWEVTEAGRAAAEAGKHAARWNMDGRGAATPEGWQGQPPLGTGADEGNLDAFTELPTHQSRRSRQIRTGLGVGES